MLSRSHDALRAAARNVYSAADGSPELMEVLLLHRWMTSDPVAIRPGSI